jgi:hypothetical protein
MAQRMMVEPVYANPEAPAPAPAVPPAFKLYSTGQVTAASFFGATSTIRAPPR